MTNSEFRNSNWLEKWLRKFNAIIHNLEANARKSIFKLQLLPFTLRPDAQLNRGACNRAG